MKKLLRKHPEAVLAILALVFVGAMVYAWTWGIGSVVSSLYGAVTARGGGTENVGFNIQAAQQLDLRGLAKPGQ